MVDFYAGLCWGIQFAIDLKMGSKVTGFADSAKFIQNIKLEI